MYIKTTHVGRQGPFLVSCLLFRFPANGSKKTTCFIYFFKLFLSSLHLSPPSPVSWKPVFCHLLCLHCIQCGLTLPERKMGKQNTAESKFYIRTRLCVCMWTVVSFQPGGPPLFQLHPTLRRRNLRLSTVSSHNLPP